MTRRKKKVKEPKLCRGKIIDPVLLRARNLRASLLKRVGPELKLSTPTILNLEKWLRLPNYICHYCLKEIVLEDAQVDHKTPISKGGGNMIENLCIACVDCNICKGEMKSEEYRELMEIVKIWEDGGKYLFTRLRRGNMIWKR